MLDRKIQPDFLFKNTVQEQKIAYCDTVSSVSSRKPSTRTMGMCCVTRPLPENQLPHQQQQQQQQQQLYLCNISLVMIQNQFSFSSVPWPFRSSVGRTWGTIQQRSSSSLFCRRPLWAVLAWAQIASLRCCPSSISCDNHGVSHPPRCPVGWFWRGCHGMRRVWTMQVLVSWQLPEDIPWNPQGSWSCSAPYHWSCGLSRRCGEVSGRITGH